jgi:hypothetical protein
VTHADPRNFQPANITFDLLPPLEKKVRDRKERHRMQCERALKACDGWLEQAGIAGVSGGGAAELRSAGQQGAVVST